jgi:hypothetical protein
MYVVISPVTRMLQVPIFIVHVCAQAQETDGSLQSIVHNAVNDPSAQAAFAHVMEAAATETKAISQISGPSMAPAPGVGPSCYSFHRRYSLMQFFLLSIRCCLLQGTWLSCVGRTGL